MKFKKTFWALALVLSLSDSAWSEGNIHFGSLEIHPYFSVKETYSDNIYFTAAEKKHDYIASTIPGFGLEFPFRADDKFAVDYNAVFNRYAEFKLENTTDQNASGLLDLKFGSFFDLKLTDVYAKGHEPRGASSTGFIEKFETNTPAGSLTYQLAELSKVQIDYARTTRNFETSQFRNRDEDLTSAYLYYRFLPKTSVFLEYDRKDVDFENLSNLNNTVDIGFLGLIWEITEKSKSTVKGGYQWKNFSDASQVDYSTWAASIDLSHEFTEYTSLYLVGQRVINEATLLGLRYFVSTGAYAEFTHRFVEKIAVVVRGSYSKDKFSDAIVPETVVREDSTMSGGIGLEYLIQDWLEVVVDYNHRTRDSNINANDYDENSYMLTITVAL